MGSDLCEIPAGGQSTELAGVSGKTAAELFEGVSIAWEGTRGAVTGTFHKITGWDAFSTGELGSGHYFFVKLSDAFNGKEITCVGKNTKKARDLYWVIRIDDAPGKTFTFKCGGSVILTLDFSGATLE